MVMMSASCHFSYGIEGSRLAVVDKAKERRLRCLLSSLMHTPVRGKLLDDRLKIAAVKS